VDGNCTFYPKIQFSSLNYHPFSGWPPKLPRLTLWLPKLPKLLKNAHFNEISLPSFIFQLKKIKKLKEINKLEFYFIFLKKLWVFGVTLFPECLGVVLFSNRNPIFLTPLWSSSVCNAMMTDFIAQFNEFRFTIINLLISAGLMLPLLWKISST